MIDSRPFLITTLMAAIFCCVWLLATDNRPSFPAQWEALQTDPVKEAQQYIGHTWCHQTENICVTVTGFMSGGLKVSYTGLIQTETVQPLWNFIVCIAENPDFQKSQENR